MHIVEEIIEKLLYRNPNSSGEFGELGEVGYSRKSLKGVLIFSSKRGICDHQHILRHWKSRLADHRHMMDHMALIVVRSNLGVVEIDVVTRFTIMVLGRLVRWDLLIKDVLDPIVGYQVSIAILDAILLKLSRTGLKTSNIGNKIRHICRKAKKGTRIKKRMEDMDFPERDDTQSPPPPHPLTNPNNNAEIALPHAFFCIHSLQSIQGLK